MRLGSLVLNILKVKFLKYWESSEFSLSWLELVFSSGTGDFSALVSLSMCDVTGILRMTGKVEMVTLAVASGWLVNGTFFYQDVFSVRSEASAVCWGLKVYKLQPIVTVHCGCRSCSALSSWFRRFCFSFFFFFYQFLENISSCPHMFTTWLAGDGGVKGDKLPRRWLQFETVFQHL